MKYGELPTQIGIYPVVCEEMMFYQYLPIKMIGESYKPTYEERLKCFNDLIGVICCDFIGTYGLDRYMTSYIYLTAKRLYQVPNCSFNRPGYHADGFMTDDVNYIWCDKNPTVFNSTDFVLTMDDSGSLVEMEQQATAKNEITFPENALLRLNQFNIHKVAENTQAGMRTFLKISFSMDKYDLKGNSHNYLFDYDWQMKDRKEERNIPQTSPKIHQWGRKEGGRRWFLVYLCKRLKSYDEKVPLLLWELLKCETEVRAMWYL